MCGIAGYLDSTTSTSAERLSAIGLSMGRALAHRGPDDEGSWMDAAAGVVLAHRRLSILDLTAEGHQPMHSAEGRYVVSFNGEIYNWPELRAELEARAHRFRGHSDTEVMLAAIVEWGLLRAAARFNGMFAAAVWDRSERRLHLLRDRFGEKPLYYGWSGSRFVFASELKSIAACPEVALALDRDVVALYLRHGQVGGARCIWAGLAKVLPGQVVSVAPERRGEVEARAFWSARAVAERATSSRASGGATEEELLADLHRALMASVRRRMVSDVPLGAFLSGGIDSSTIVALMQAQSDRPVKTFTIGFLDDTFDEAAHARAVAAHLGTEHTELYVTGDDALAVVPDLPRVYDEPFADSSQIPTCLVAALARRSVTVGLSGDAGDELFGGYARYRVADRLWRGVGWMPRRARAAVAGVIEASPGVVWEAARRVLGRRAFHVRRRDPASGLRAIARLVRSDDVADLYARLMTGGGALVAAVVGASEPPPWPADDGSPWTIRHLVERMMLWDTIGYLPDDILTKVDRSTMAVGLEARVPFLDPEVFELAWRLPLEVKIRGGVGKWPVRQILHRYVPRALVDRPKMGFGVPLASWLRGPLREWAHDLLEPRRLEAQGLLDAAPVAAMLEEHMAGTRDRHHELWALLVLQAWLDTTGARTHRGGREAATAPRFVGVGA
jgi:asparagine synthase (glutamine-hydrolysing)